jgi:hypothetical protein
LAEGGDEVVGIAGEDYVGLEDECVVASLGGFVVEVDELGETLEV